MNCVVEILVPHTTRLNLAPLLYGVEAGMVWGGGGVSTKLYTPL